VEEKFLQFLRDERAHLYPKFEWLGLFDNHSALGLKDASPAQLLETILKTKLTLKEGDKDMLVMYHEFEYTLNNSRHKIISSMVNIGEDQVYTSMSNTVGLPVAIAAKLILKGKIQTKGVTLPVNSEVYLPILEELALLGICFHEEHSVIP
jgi:saccharopine dehydrogenase-like NADP-dependent oxidoreductase